ncbi:hypothetical protein MKW98_013672, partial [Papaver atlanticum]
MQKLPGKMSTSNVTAKCELGTQTFDQCPGSGFDREGKCIPLLARCNILSVKEKRIELERSKTTFVRRASEFLMKYFASL